MMIQIIVIGGQPPPASVLSELSLTFASQPATLAAPAASLESAEGTDPYLCRIHAWQLRTMISYLSSACLLRIAITQVYYKGHT